MWSWLGIEKDNSAGVAALRAAKIDNKRHKPAVVIQHVLPEDQLKIYQLRLIKALNERTVITPHVLKLMRAKI